MGLSIPTAKEAVQYPKLALAPHWPLNIIHFTIWLAWKKWPSAPWLFTHHIISSQPFQIQYNKGIHNFRALCPPLFPAREQPFHIERPITHITSQLEFTYLSKHDSSLWSHASKQFTHFQLFFYFLTILAKFDYGNLQTCVTALVWGPISFFLWGTGSRNELDTFSPIHSL